MIIDDDSTKVFLKNLIEYTKIEHFYILSLEGKNSEESPENEFVGMMIQRFVRMIKDIHMMFSFSLKSDQLEETKFLMLNIIELFGNSFEKYSIELFGQPLANRNELFYKSALENILTYLKNFATYKDHNQYLETCI